MATEIIYNNIKVLKSYKNKTIIIHHLVYNMTYWSTQSTTSGGLLLLHTVQIWFGICKLWCTEWWEPLPAEGVAKGGLQAQPVALLLVRVIILETLNTLEWKKTTNWCLMHHKQQCKSAFNTKSSEVCLVIRHGY